MTLLDSPFLTYLMPVLAGAVYFVIYRLFFNRVLKWKMIHAIWIPLIFSTAMTIYAVSLLSTPWFGANRSFLSQVGVIAEVNLPSISFFILFFLFGKRK